MGLRDILGLPPKKKTSQTTPVPEDPGVWDDMVKNHDLVVKDKRFDLLGPEDKTALNLAWTQANVLSSHNRYTEAAALLRPAVGLAAQNMVRAASTLKAYEADSRTAEGLLDEGALIGVKAAVIKPLRHRLETARKLRATDLPEAARQMGELAGELATHGDFVTARNARDTVLKERPGVERDTEKALKIPPETGPVAKALRALTHFSGLVGALVGKLDYVGALSPLQACRQAIETIKSEATAIAEAVKLRDQVLKARKKLEAKIEAARQIYGVSDEGKALVESFKSADDSYYRAVQAKDYTWAMIELGTLGRLVDPVIALASEVEQDARDRAPLLEDKKAIIKLFGQIQAFPAITTEMDGLIKQIGADWSSFVNCMEALEYDRALQLSKVLKTGLAHYLELGKASAELVKQKKLAEKDWTTRIKPRLEQVALLVPKSKPLTEAIDAVDTLRRAAKAAIKKQDEAGIVREMALLTKALDEVDRLALLDAKMAEAAKDASKVYKVLHGRIQTILNAATVTPEFRKAQDAVTQLSDAARQAIRDCAVDAPDRVKALAEALGTAEQLLPANTEQKAEKAKQVQELVIPLRKEIFEAVKLLVPALPLSEALRDALDNAHSRIGTLFAKGRYDAALELAQSMADKVREAKEKVQGWTETVEKVKTDVLEARRRREKDVEKLLNWDSTPFTYTLLGEFRAGNQRVDRCIQSSNFAEAQEAQALLEKTMDTLLQLEARYEDHGVKSKAVAKIKKRVASKAEKAAKAATNTPEALDLRDRIKRTLARAERLDLADEMAECLTAWTEVEDLMTQWTGVYATDQKDEPADKLECERLWNALDPDYTIARTMTAIPKSLAPLRKAFATTRSAVLRAEAAKEWTTAVKLYEPFIKATKALAAEESTHLQAMAQAQQKSDDSRQTILATPVSTLKTKPLAERLDLLDALRGKGQKLTKEERKAQRQIYATMEMDATFQKLEDTRRDVLIEELTQDKEVAGARKGWGAMSAEARLKVLEKVLAAECRVYNIPAPPIRLFNVPPGDEGFFASSNGTLNLNTHPESGFSDYKEALDTVLHENMHNMQDVLMQRLEEGILQPGDPEYDQAMLFAANNGGYVPPDEDDEVAEDEVVQNAYEHQPLEMHAWGTGDTVSRGIIAGVKKPVKDVTL